MASPTQWTGVWVNFGSWQWTGRPCVLQSMGLQRVRHDWATWTELNWILLALHFLGMTFWNTFTCLSPSHQPVKSSLASETGCIRQPQLPCLWECLVQGAAPLCMLVLPDLPSEACSLQPCDQPCCCHRMGVLSERFALLGISVPRSRCPSFPEAGTRKTKEPWITLPQTSLFGLQTVHLEIFWVMTGTLTYFPLWETGWEASTSLISQGFLWASLYLGRLGLLPWIPRQGST